MKVADPVCGMQIETEQVAGKTEYQGVTYWFCSDSCLKKFEAQPSRYARPK
jgi:P-type Cu+ transporter